MDQTTTAAHRLIDKAEKVSVSGVDDTHTAATQLFEHAVL
jgi:hypothetical protein